MEYYTKIVPKLISAIVYIAWFACITVVARRKLSKRRILAIKKAALSSFF
jgi:hypothetical protein